MATKKCINGHQYDASIYGDNCPFCPSSTSTHTVVNPRLQTTTMGGNTEAPTIPCTPNVNNNVGGGATVIRRVGEDNSSNISGRKLVGVFISYNTNALGDVFKVYEGRNLVGRAADCDIIINNDANVSSHHLLIHYVDAEGIYWAEDQHSSNGTYINGAFSRGFTEIKTNDIIVIGATKLLFLGITQF